VNSFAGAGFGATQSDSIVTFDGVAATVSSWSDTQIVAIVPAGAASGPVTVAVAANTVDGPTFEISTSVTLTDSLGHQSTYASEMVGGKWYVNNSQGSGCSSCTVRGNIQTNYDNFGNVILTTDELGHTTSYSYDSNQNLLSVSQQANLGYATTSYTYNSFGEPLTVTDPLRNITTNTYDAHGNLLTVATPAPNSNTAASVTQFAYNSLGELTQITDPLGRITKLAYTSAGLIYTITDPQNNVTTYAYDSEGDRTSVTDAMNNQTTFAYDSWDRLLTITYPGGTTMSNAAGSVANTYIYDSYGNLTASTGSLTNRFQYTGRESDPETGLYYYRARYYDPNSGRFLREDPIGFNGGKNFYPYVGNSPPNFWDPSGKQSCCGSVAATYAAVGAAGGGAAVALGSVVVDAATGGLNILATPGEVAAGAVVGETSD
jgi:RHS repeat-associated protein